MNTKQTKPDIHSIRLHGPWDAKVVAVYGSHGTVGQERRAKIPSDWGDWLGADFCGQVEYRRSFNRPTGLEPDQQVWLVVEQLDFHCDLIINAPSIGSLTWGQSPESPFRIEIGQSLELSNVLRIDIQDAADYDRAHCAGLAGGLVGSVRIEIEQ